MLLGVLVAEALHRFARLPRVMGMMLVGALASPFALRLIESAELDPWKPLLDLAIGVLVFELGSRIRPQWLFENPWLAASCVLEGVLAGVAVTVALSALGAPMLSAAMAGAVAMSTSPVITMAMVHEDKPRGQVTERLLMTSALNSIVAMLAVKAWRVMAAAGSPSPGVEMLTMAASALYVTCGSFLVGVACGWLLHRLSRASGSSNTVPVLQIALVIVATLLAAQWKLSPLLALLVAGVTARLTMGHRLTVEPHLGSAGAVLTVLLFISLGLLFTLDGAMTLWPWVLAIIVVRLRRQGSRDRGDRRLERARLAAGDRADAGAAADEQPRGAAGRRHLRLAFAAARHRSFGAASAAAGHDGDAAQRPAVGAVGPEACGA